jgi:hypothetical protein
MAMIIRIGRPAAFAADQFVDAPHSFRHCPAVNTTKQPQAFAGAAAAADIISIATTIGELKSIAAAAGRTRLLIAVQY